jgi:putative endonuclease
MSKKNWLVYIAKCKDGTFYTGCTNDLGKRLKKHNNNVGAKYTKGRTPIKLIYTEMNLNKSQALQKEHEIKQLSRQEKIKLIKNMTKKS